MTIIIARVLLVVAIAAFAGAAALAFSSTQPKEYSAVERFAFGRLLSPELQALGAGFGEPDVEEDIRTLTEADIMNADEIGEATARAHPELGYSAGEINGRVVAVPARGTLIVDLRATASSPALAARLVTAYGEQYLTLRRARERRQATEVLRVLQSRLARMSERERATLAGSNLQGHITDLEVLRRHGTNTPQVIARARASGAAVSPRTQRNVIFALVLGLAVGVGMVALRSEGRSRKRVAAARRAAARPRGDSVESG